MLLVNLTPHAVRFVADGGEISIPPSGIIARCAVTRTEVDRVTVQGLSIPVNRSAFGQVIDLPDPEPGVLYIVSALVAQAARRPDVVGVDDAVRDANGQIVGARALARFD